MNCRGILLTLLTTLLALTAASGSALAEEPAPLPGKFTIPFKKEMVNVHPRLLFSRDDMARWQKAGPSDQKFIYDEAASYFKLCGTPIPTAGEPWNVGDGWQKFGWWRGTTTLFYYAKTGDKKYANNAIDLMLAMCRSDHWEVGSEQDYGMGTGNIMATVALIYDTTYDLLTDDQRQLVRKRLFLAADRFYHYGYTEEKKLPNASVRYWQNDPQNNHRWHRLAGYLMGCLAIYGEEPGIDGYLDHALKEAAFIEKWLPEDGSSHESVAYQAFGTSFLVPAFVALDNCVGNDAIRKNPFFHNVPYFRAHMVTPNGRNVWGYGDGDEGTYYFAHYNFKLASEWKDPIAQALHLRNFQLSPDSYSYHGFTLIWHDPSLKAGDLSTLPTYRYFPDIEIATFRQSWTDASALAAFFKCGPYGGHQLNAYRDSFTPPHYVNVAHDHPDANEFLFAWHGQLFAQESGEDKKTDQHNTILVNGKGQAGEGDAYTQPIPSMGKRARIEEYFGAPGFGMVRGEAGAFYAGLKRYARTFLYIDDAYLVVADDLQAPQPAAIDWLYHCGGQWKAAGAESWLIAKGSDSVRLTLAAPADLKTRTAPQGRVTCLTASATGTALRMLMVLAPQSARPAEIVSTTPTPAGFVLKVKRGDLIDLVAIGPCDDAQSGIQSDAQTAVVTLNGDRPVKMMLIGGTRVAAGKTLLGFSGKVDALLDVASGSLMISAPLGARESKATITASGLAVKTANGKPVSGAVDVPTWTQKQDNLK